MIFAYNTNGFAHHRLDDALDILAELGYGGVSITLDFQHLDPFGNDFAAELTRARRKLDQLGMRCAIETGARFLLDPRRKHQPTLLSPNPLERGNRLAFLERSVSIAKALGAECVSFWSGTPLDPEDSSVLFDRLVEGCKQLLNTAERSGVKLAFEPEPGMLLENMDQFEELHSRLDHELFGLTLDVGHLVCTGELPISKFVNRWPKQLWNIHIEDMERGIHDHLMFGEGELDFHDAFQALRGIQYGGLVSVELSRHSHDAVRTAQRSLEFLKGIELGVS